MNLHEYQGKQLFAEYGLPVSIGFACDTPEEAAQAADRIGGSRWVVKAQVHAGGRGKGKYKELGPDAKGGVRLAHSIDEVRANAYLQRHFERLDRGGKGYLVPGDLR